VFALLMIVAACGGGGGGGDGDDDVPIDATPPGLDGAPVCTKPPVYINALAGGPATYRPGTTDSRNDRYSPLQAWRSSWSAPAGRSSRSTCRCRSSTATA
jgi:hypothetical protein